MRAELKLRLKKLRQAGAFDKTDRIVFYNPEADHLDPNFTYLSNVAAEYSVLVATPRSATLYTVPMLAPRVRGSWCKVVVTQSLGTVLKRWMKGRVGINGRFMPWRIPKKLNARAVDVSDALEKARSVKTREEIERIRAAAKDARAVLSRVRIEKGRREAEIAADLAYEMLKRGDEPSFDIIVAADRNTASPHHVPTATRVEDFCYVDFGMRKDHYCSDLTRCFVFKRSYQQYVDLVQHVLDQLEDHIRPGVRTADLHKTTEKLLGKYAKNFIHALGHGIGLEVHELPHIGPRAKDVLEAGMTIAIEPAFYLKNRFGVRLENNYVVTRNGCKRL